MAIELEPVVDQFRKAASQAGSVFVDKFIRGEERASPFEFIIGLDAALLLIERAKPG